MKIKMTSEQLKVLHQWRKAGLTDLDIENSSLKECEKEYERIYKSIQSFLGLGVKL